ncbi:MAG: FadR/GntR family transcriptional regulator [Alphaproteobacteria bacterium]
MNAPAKKLAQIRPGSRRTGQDNIAAALGEEILSGARKPGERMPSDADMHKMFGVSRVVTREVIKTLAAKGLVASKMKVGTIVLEPTHWNWLDSDVLSWRANMGLDMDFLAHITDVRRAVEPTAAALAAIYGSKADVAKLREAIAAMSGAGSNRRQFAEADLRFHLAVSTASRNPFFQSFAATIETALFALLSVNAITENSRQQSEAIEMHVRVADAIEDRDPHMAAKAMLRAVDGGLSHAKRRKTAPAKT